MYSSTLKEISNLVESGHTLEALRVVSEAIEQTPGAEDLVIAKAQLLAITDSENAAQTFLQISWSHGVRTSEIALQLSKFAERNSDSDSVSYWLEHARNFEPNDARIWNCLGLFWFRDKNYSVAAAYFRCAVRSDPTLITGWLNLANCARLMNEFSMQKQCASEALRLTNDRSIEAKICIALAEFDLGNTDTAEQLLKEMINRSVQSADLSLLEALIDERRGNIEAALYSLAEIYENYPHEINGDSWFLKYFDNLFHHDPVRGEEFVNAQGFSIYSNSKKSALASCEKIVDIIILNKEISKSMRSYLSDIGKSKCGFLGNVLVISETPTDLLIENGKVIVLGEDVSISSKLQTALKFSESPYVVIVDGSVSVTHHWLDKLLMPFEDQEGVGMTIPVIVVNDTEEQIREPGAILLPENLSIQDTFELLADMDLPSVAMPFPCAPVAMLRTDALKDVGGFTEVDATTVSGLIRDIALRMSLGGLEVKLAPNAAVLASFDVLKIAHNDHLRLLNFYGGLNVLTAQALTARNKLATRLSSHLSSIGKDDEARQPKVVSYAQNFEDIYLLRALNHIKYGQYVDIGASDPLVDSVSRAFYERGWRGIHVEPLTRQVQQLKRYRLGDTILQVAVSNQDGVLTLYDVNNGLGISTLEGKQADQYRREGFTVKETSVPSVTLEHIFNTYIEHDLHWLKIDVEGHEENVIHSWRNSTVRPWIIVVESTVPMTSEANHYSWEPEVLTPIPQVAR